MRLSLGLPPLLLSLLAPASAAAQPLDLQKLFSSGVLSPDYPRQHAGSSARPLSLASGSNTLLTLQFNPALAPLGLWSFRAELAPLPYLSVLLDYGRIRSFNVPKFKGRVHLDGNLFDLALHVWPQGLGARGFYAGPRLARGSGEDHDGLGEGSLSGWGADLGYQWVFGLVSLNLGAGLGQATASITPGASTPPELLSATEETFLRPYATAAFGLAF